MIGYVAAIFLLACAVGGGVVSIAQWRRAAESWRRADAEWKEARQQWERAERAWIEVARIRRQREWRP